MDNKVKVFAGNAGRGLAQEICKFLSIDLGKVTVERFSDGEIKVEFLENIREADVFIINPTHPPAENLLEIMILAQAARLSSAGRVTLVIPYLGYNRQDRKDKPRVPISAKVVAKMLSLVEVNRIIFLDLHSEVTIGFFDGLVPDHLYGSYVTVPYLKTAIPEPFVVASPDTGATNRARVFAKLLGTEDFVVFDKKKWKAGEEGKNSIKIVGDVENKNILFVDDMIDTGGTLVSDAKAAKEAGACRIFACATHPLFSGSAIKKLDESCIEEMIVTNSIHHNPKEIQTERVKITVISVAPLLAKAIQRTHSGESLSSLILN